ncbi:MAG: hypothetical protein J0G32_01030 [Alphaproteobacteria bacterium]|nr:hypothetical protein [Alphaproteobacteria bacterium]OJV13201.1 MAG: hypothetical protein BGO27_00150 [Alphaproteobacteria bacterium 33-17]
MTKITQHIYIKDEYNESVNDAKFVDQNGKTVSLKFVDEATAKTNSLVADDIRTFDANCYDGFSYAKIYAEYPSNLTHFSLGFKDYINEHNHTYIMVDSSEGFDWETVDGITETYPYEAHSFDTDYGRELVIDYLL